MQKHHMCIAFHFAEETNFLQASFEIHRVNATAYQVIFKSFEMHRLKDWTSITSSLNFCPQSGMFIPLEVLALVYRLRAQFYVLDYLLLKKYECF